ncbi:DUF3899 domain-containing protein [Acholeplasma laidlawii]|jgi:hypothetical protein|uniref:DUF3899 domain-containing protein n=1 Tax=Acholeplasma laidlawii TaxID=2148 RepID=UPI0018C1EFE5|nr:DUF3899 domain-containing protein [Acholeplasma laidlawii]MBG0762930.1 DUF3899 domain-containing protein [Acholeplasma laidlawii]WIF88263.1 DUF3899 domain-containing protein [Acholeplasma laidlawii]
MRDKRKILKLLLIDIVIGSIVFGLIYLYSPDWKYFFDYFYVSAAILFTFGWMVFVANEGVFDLFIYGVQQFFKGIVGKRMKMTYPEYIQDRNIIDRMTYIMLWTTSLLFALTGLIIQLTI